jgi:manganese efflux pump family protein
MTPAELLLLAVALAMDAVAVSLALGLRLRRPRPSEALLAAGVFGLFQGMMPLLGWALAFSFAAVVASAAPWIAFTVLVLIGVNMLREAREDHAEEEMAADSGTGSGLTLRQTLPLAVATSIDAAAVGVTFGVLDVAVAPAVTVIGLVTFVLSLVAVVVGSRAGERLGSRAEVLGGVILILIGVRILLDHLGVI